MWLGTDDVFVSIDVYFGDVKNSVCVWKERKVILRDMEIMNGNYLASLLATQFGVF